MTAEVSPASLVVMTPTSTRPLDVRRVTDAEVPAWVEACNTGFYRHGVDGEVEARRQGLDLDRTWGAFDGDRIVGTLRSFATELTVPGAGGFGGHGPAAGWIKLVRAGGGAHQRHRDRHAPPHGAAHPDADRRSGGGGRAGRGGRDADRLRVPDLRPLRLRAGRRGGHLHG